MKRFLLVFFVILGVLGLFLEQQRNTPGLTGWIVSFIDYALVTYLLLDFLWDMKKSGHPLFFIKKNLFTFLFLLIYLTLFFIHLIFRNSVLSQDNSFMTVLRNLMLLLKIFGRFRKVSGFINSIITKPAQTVVFSFVMVILVGALLLMMPVMNRDAPLGPLDALFTATSAVCVTGLIVVDTAVHFTIPGKAVIMMLIQIGGLGIMLLSFFMVYLFKQSVSLKEKQLLTYMLNSSSMNSIKSSIMQIIRLTFLIGFIGGVLLFPLFMRSGLSVPTALFYSIFHAVSAFCNAGFALYSDSLMTFRSSGGINLVIAGLIIAGGISFAVLTDLYTLLFSMFKRRKHTLSINSRVVLIVSSLLTVIGTFMIYKLEHENLLFPAPLGEQYLSALFQSVTLRTAGFNTLPFESLTKGTLMLMIGIMFIGGASGSTAGGIKVNTLGVIWAYIRSFRRGKEEILLYKHQIPKEQILQAFTVIVFAVLSVFTVTTVLMISETAPPLPVLFETVSAFATVGLSTGITGSLTAVGKTGIILLMFLGRLGPLTMLTASSGRERQSNISYPEASVMIG